VRLQAIHPAPVAIHVASTTQAGVGTQVTDGLPPQVAMLVTKRSAFAGRAARGRTYLPFLYEGGSGPQGQPTAGLLAQGTSIAQYLLTNKTMTLSGRETSLAPVIWRRLTKTYVNVTDFLVRDRFATQRRRSLLNQGDNHFP
jgi:hypothetical protein